MDATNILHNYFSNLNTFLLKLKKCLFRKTDTKKNTDTKILNIELEEAEKEKNPWLFCVVCKNKITKKKDKIEVDAKHSHTFLNPHGVYYNIRCFKNAPGCIPFGELTEEYTWFPSFAWQIVVCGKCKIHNGWKYDSGKSTFYGLIDNRLSSTGK
jgi:hypothetical protein